MSRLSFSYLITELLYYLGVKSRLQNDTFIALPRVSCTTWAPASTSRLSHPAAPAKMQHTVPGPDSSRGTVQPASHSSTSSTVPPATMTINLRNPMVFPAHTKINLICTSPIRVLFPRAALHSRRQYLCQLHRLAPYVDLTYRTLRRNICAGLGQITLRTPGKRSSSIT
jgi:hypothetical protein